MAAQLKINVKVFLRAHYDKAYRRWVCKLMLDAERYLDLAHGETEVAAVDRMLKRLLDAGAITKRVYNAEIGKYLESVGATCEADPTGDAIRSE